MDTIMHPRLSGPARDRDLPPTVGPQSCVDVLIGGQYGSEGKGQIASYIAKEYDYLVRVGGPNAGHKVHEEPIPYTFHQLPSGTRSSRPKLILGPGSLIDLDALFREIIDCSVTPDRLFIDPKRRSLKLATVMQKRRFESALARRRKE